MNTRAITTKNDGPVRRGRGRPRGFDRDQALERALKTFWRLGYEGASITDLTDAMGVTTPSLYTAFGSKAELYKEALDRYRALTSPASNALTEEPTAKAAFARLLRETAAAFSDPENPPGCMISTAVLTCAEENAGVADYARALRDNALETYQSRIEKGMTDGDLPGTADARKLARFYGAVVQGMSVQAQDGADHATLLSIAEAGVSAWDSLIVS